MAELAKEDILVVGAGPAGLAVSACLRAAGLPHTMVEREQEVAPAWQRHYDRLHLHTTKRHSALPMSPWPGELPTYPSRAQVVEYLRAYAAQHEVTPRFGVEVRHIRRTGGHFEVETNQGLLKPRFVVVATGYNRVASRPALKGLERFEGRVIHSGQYKNPEPYALKRTLVVGCGNSGAEIALDLAEHGVEVAMVVRGPVHVVPRDLFGRSTQETGILLSFLPLAWRDALITAVLRLAVGDLSRWGIVRPRLGPHQTILQTGRIPLLDIGTIAKVKEGKIRVLPGVEEVLGEQVRFADGSTHPFEAIILATGYTPALAGLIGGFEAIADPRGRPHRFGEETRIPDLFFVGFKNPPTGALREIALEAPRVAEAIRQKV